MIDLHAALLVNDALTMYQKWSILGTFLRIQPVHPNPGDTWVQLRIVRICKEDGTELDLRMVSPEVLGMLNGLNMRIVTQSPVEWKRHERAIASFHILVHPREMKPSYNLVVEFDQLMILACEPEN